MISVKVYNLSGELFRQYEGSRLFVNEIKAVINTPKNTKIWIGNKLSKGSLDGTITVWRRKHVNLIEFKECISDEYPIILHASICSYPIITEHEISYTDYILDVMSKYQAPPEIHGLDVFETYIKKSQLTPDFVNYCMIYCQEAKELINERLNTFR